MKHWLKEISASILCALLLLPAAFIGVVIGMLLYFIYNDVLFLNIPDWLNIFAPPFIGGLIAGAGSVFISYKLFSPQRRFVLLSLPIGLMAISILASFATVIMFGKPWAGVFEPVSNAIGAVLGLIYMSGQLLKPASPYSHPTERLPPS